jgi:hypothetical protein
MREKTDCVRNRTYTARSVMQTLLSDLNPRNSYSVEATMLGYGLIGTLVIICLVVWLVRAL